MELIFGMLNNTTLLMFGVFVSSAMLNILFNKENIIIMSIFCLVINILLIVSYVTIGLKMTQGLYPIITHIPTLLLYVLYYKRGVLSSAFAIMSSYLCCQLSKWISILFLLLSNSIWISYGFRSLLTIVIGYIIIKYFASSLAVILTKPVKTILIFSIIPFVYYVFDYISTVYTNLLYSGSEIVFEFLPFVLCTAYLMFSVVYFKEYEEKCDIERRHQLMEMKRAQTKKEIEAIKRSEYAVSILKHDMRHFLMNINSFIENEEFEKAKEYINEVVKSSDRTKVHRYCENEIVNMIISSYKNEMFENDISFDYLIKIPTKLEISDVDFTSILSNGLENAIHAVLELDVDKRNILLDLRYNDDKLLLSIKNPYTKKVSIVNGVPESRKEGHGLGAHSIKYIVEKLNGNYQFSASNGQFTLRVVL